MHICHFWTAHLQWSPHESHFISIYDLSKVWLSQIYFCSWPKAVFTRPPTKSEEFCVWIVGGLTNEKPTSDKVVTMLINARHWTRRALLMWWTPKWLCEKTRSKTQSNLCYGIVLLVFLTIYQNIVQSKMLNSFLFTVLMFLYQGLFLKIVFKTLWKLFKLPNIFVRFVLKTPLIRSKFSLKFSHLTLGFDEPCIIS